MSNVTRNAMEGGMGAREGGSGGGEGVGPVVARATCSSLQGHLMGVTLTARAFPLIFNTTPSVAVELRGLRSRTTPYVQYLSHTSAHLTAPT